ncbi:MAG: phage tail protein, partial [Cetobacterium sp.]|nr:phage tail protein [Cetobacterium sp.]
FEFNGDRTLTPNSCELIVQLNGICEIELEHPYDLEKSWTYLETEDVIAAPTPWSDKQLFRIYDREKTITGLKVYARHIYFDLAKYNIESNLHIKSKNGKKALKLMLKNTPFIAHSNIVDINDCYFFKNNVLEGVAGNKDNCFLNRWGGELFLDNYNVYINSRVGGNKGIRISYGYNLENISLKRNTEEVFTRIYPYVIKNTTDTIELPEKYVDSKYINNYPNIYEKYINLSEFMHLKDGEDDNDNAYETLEDLYMAMRDKCKELFENGLDTPKTSGTVNMVILENTTEYENVKELAQVNLGDDILVEHYDIGIESKTRCVGYRWNCITKRYLKIEVGELEKDFFDLQNTTTHDLNNILNKDGSINSGKLQGIINSLSVQFRGMRDVAQKQHILAVLFEDRIKGSATYGALALGTKGLLIANERLPDDSDWDWRTFIKAGLVYADVLIGVLKTVLIQNMDKSFEIDLNKSGGALFKNNGKVAIEIVNNMINLYNYMKDEDYIGGMKALIYNNDPNKPVVGLGNDFDSALMLTYPLRNEKHSPYIAFDKYGVLGSQYPIMIYEESYFTQATRFLKALFEGNELFGDDAGNLVIKLIENGQLGIFDKNERSIYLFGENYFTFPGFHMARNSDDIWALKNLKTDKNFHANGDLSCSGQKNRIVDTNHYGKIKMNAFETTECYFGDVGRAKLKDGKYIIKMDKKFLETVNTNIQYEVQTWAYGNGNVWVEPSEMYPQYVIVRGTNDIEFGYNIMPKQKGYENSRMEEHLKERSSTVRINSKESGC